MPLQTHQQELSARLQRAREEAQTALAELGTHISGDQQRLDVLRASVAEAEPKLERLQADDGQRQIAWRDAETRLADYSTGSNGVSTTDGTYDCAGAWYSSGQSKSAGRTIIQRPDGTFMVVYFDDTAQVLASVDCSSTPSTWPGAATPSRSLGPAANNLMTSPARDENAPGHGSMPRT